MTQDEAYARVREHCLAKEAATEEYPWGDVIWKIRGKIFAGSSDGSNQVTVKATPEEQATLIEHPSIEVAKYVGRFGWVTITVKSKKTLALTLDLIDHSFDHIDAAANVRGLDGEGAKWRLAVVGLGRGQENSDGRQIDPAFEEIQLAL